MNQSLALAKIKTIIRTYLPDQSYRLFLFGSRVAGYAKPYSDFDIGIAGPRVPQITIGTIKDALEESNLPYKVDVVDFTDVSDTFRVHAEKYSQTL